MMDLLFEAAYNLYSARDGGLLNDSKAYYKSKPVFSKLYILVNINVVGFFKIYLIFN